MTTIENCDILIVGGEDMNLYCYKLKNSSGKITDVHHIVAKNDKGAHAILDRHIKQCSAHGLGEEYNSYSFSKVDCIDGFRVKLYDDNPTPQ